MDTVNMDLQTSDSSSRRMEFVSTVYSIQDLHCRCSLSNISGLLQPSHRNQARNRLGSSNSPISSIETTSLSVSNLDPEFRSRGLRPDATPEYGSPPNWTQQESSPVEASRTMPSHSQTIEVSARPRAVEPVEASSHRQDANGKKRKRRVRHPDALEYETEDRPRDVLLKRKLRWLYLRQFNTEGLEQIISQVHGTNDDTSYTFSSNRTYILDTCRGWKSKSLSKMVVSFIFIFHSFTYDSNQKFRSMSRMRKRSPERSSSISGCQLHRIPRSFMRIL
jgi:hypothetical protein